MEYLFESSARRTWREGSFTGDSEGHIKEGSRNMSFSVAAPLVEPWRVCSFGREFETKVRFYQETLFIGESERYVKEGSGNKRLSS
jgi:hypothetical protein